MAVLAAAAAVSTLVAPAAALEPITRDKILELAAYSEGYSYWWGHGRFRLDKSDIGSCSGNCPDCTHKGSHGGDCSGLVGKAWQVPKPSDMDHDDHPYSTVDFKNDTTHWDPIDRGDATRGDAFVHNDNGAGHTYVYEKDDPWGDHWAYECKGCSYGCPHNIRTANDTYIVIRRRALDEGPHLDATFVAQWSDADPDTEGKAHFQVCAKAAVRMWFELKNSGGDAWRDLGDAGAKSGEDVRLGVPGDVPDPLTGTTRVSLTENANDEVVPGGTECDDQPGCNRTVFTKAGILGKAPAQPGVYTSTWQLVDEGRTWFGPTMTMSFNVIACPEVPGTGGPGDVGGGAGGGDVGGGAGGGGATGAGRGGAPAAITDGAGDAGDGTMSGSSCAAGGAPREGGAVALAAIALGLAVGARRRAARGVRARVG
jgi:hypothetical protein